MKKILLSALTLLAVVACSKFDDSEIWSELKDHEERIVKLETLCNQLNTNITSLQTIIIALQNNDYVTNISPIKEGSKEIGYTITFAKSGSITIYHGKDGENGKDGVNGTDGKDGKDGYTPKIGVKQHTDGKYYWTLDGTWLLDDNGNMIPTTGEDGTDGSNGKDGKDGENGTNGKDGKDGITPQLKIEDGYWYLSYDNGATWQKLGKATGNNGLDGIPGADGADGEDGDSIIDSITQDNENVYFNLTDGTLITLPKRNTDTIVFEDLSVKIACCIKWDTNNDGELSYSEAANVTKLGTFKENTEIRTFDELKYFTGITSIPDSAFENCANLWKVTLPPNVISIGTGAFRYCENLRYLKISDSVTSINGQAFGMCGLKTLIIPSNTKTLGDYVFSYCDNLKTIYLKSSSPAVIGSSIFMDTDIEKIYVPMGAGETYKSDSKWKTYASMIEEYDFVNNPIN